MFLSKSYAFPYLPMEVLSKLNPEQQKVYLEQMDKVKYDLMGFDYLRKTDLLKQELQLFENENCFVFERGGATKIRTISKHQRSIIYMYIEREKANKVVETS